MCIDESTVRTHFHLELEERRPRKITGEFIKDILEVIEKEVDVKLGQIVAVKELEQTLKANKYMHKVDNILPDLKSKEITLCFFESLGAYWLKEEIRMCKSLFYSMNFVLLSFGVFN
ncbi:hypothetical protein PHYBLDRAFT_67150 [Phycomyces blakesleeanus NRRL 1555(-)]|uniref:Uncharacterized protein n=1 Tax=Phycomyces blakesleeanus (strain ATCC 8743b / DSM 1359 / FGSC 10004 / NBRC 33097 / NRRL 1555) TaxID=763407 RepID=A0A167KWK9_PHYB8|nr:hypothetical protein PHYBLDRAFT_67150 [Phycomyces blakesleeanus NRRL 1555(-)]OAD69056.1 hypothetical protein PHYBLDRAFT_67150 [Phycomyces blakesleeanus NRRL 1555(-)]|eukprot:XP_018287096.1 hypothetical protein PHYBLDRAFT_67150 [Phycomyces blakesleeanus NRRL 1555(-)]